MDFIISNEDMRLKPYTDTVGKLTIGVGRNLDDNGISEMEALLMLKNDIDNATKDLESIFGSEFFNELPEDVIIALTDMMFNLGKTRFLGFKNMIQAIKNKDFERASREAVDSKWCKQVGLRCAKVANKLFNK